MAAGLTDHVWTLEELVQVIDERVVGQFENWLLLGGGAGAGANSRSNASRPVAGGSATASRWGAGRRPPAGGAKASSVACARSINESGTWRMEDSSVLYVWAAGGLWPPVAVPPGLWGRFGQQEAATSCWHFFTVSVTAYSPWAV